jgi:HSP20 family molecular chaperone IbpA
MVLRLVRTATVEGDKVAASFKNDVLTIPVPESAQAQGKTRRIPINGGSVEH